MAYVQKQKDEQQQQGPGAGPASSPLSSSAPVASGAPTASAQAPRSAPLTADSFGAVKGWLGANQGGAQRLQQQASQQVGSDVNAAQSADAQARSAWSGAAAKQTADWQAANKQGFNDWAGTHQERASFLAHPWAASAIPGVSITNPQPADYQATAAPTAPAFDNSATLQGVQAAQDRMSALGTQAGREASGMSRMDAALAGGGGWQQQLSAKYAPLLQSLQTAQAPTAAQAPAASLQSLAQNYQAANAPMPVQGAGQAPATTPAAFKAATKKRMF